MSIIFCCFIINDIDTLNCIPKKLTYIVDILTVFHWLLSPTRGDITYGQGDIPFMKTTNDLYLKQSSFVGSFHMMRLLQIYFI